MDTKTYNVNLKAKKTHWGKLALNLSKNGKLFGSLNKPIDCEMALILTNQKHQMNKFYSNFSTMQSVPDEFILAPDLTTLDIVFANCQKLGAIDVSKFDTSNITSLYQTFSNCQSLTKIDVSNFNTSNVTMFDGVFANCKSLASLDLTTWDTSNGKDFSNAFSGCIALETIDGVIDITKAGTTISGMFNGCIKLKQVKIKATSSQQNLFRSTTRINTKTQVIFVS